MRFTDDLEAAALRTDGGEYAWPREQAARAVDELRAAGIAILGGELWLVDDRKRQGLFPTLSGRFAAVRWETESRQNETAENFVARSAAEASKAIAALPPPEALVGPTQLVYYNITWNK